MAACVDGQKVCRTVSSVCSYHFRAFWSMSPSVDQHATLILHGCTARYHNAEVYIPASSAIDLQYRISLESRPCLLLVTHPLARRHRSVSRSPYSLYPAIAQLFT